MKKVDLSTISESHELHQQQTRRGFFGKPVSGASSSTFHFQAAGFANIKEY